MGGESLFIVARDEEILIICTYIRISKSNINKKTVRCAAKGVADINC